MATTNTSLFKQSFKLAWPISLQNILVTMLGMTDIMMVAHLGDGAVASVGLSNRIQFVFLVILSGLASGVGILSAQYYGAGQIDRIKKVIVMTIVMAILTLVPLLLLNYFFASDVLNLATTDTRVINTGQSYLWVTMPSLLFVVLIMIFEKALRGTGQVKFPMVLSSVAIVINILLNYWLINGGAGIEAMGVQGAAWATSLARFLHISLLIFILIKLSHKIFPFDVRFSALTNRKDWAHCINLVWPLMLSFGVWSLGTFVYQLIYGRMGTTELAVMSLLAPLEGLLISLFLGLASACSILIGQRLGRNDFINAWGIARNYAMSAPLVTFLLALLMLQLEVIIFKPYDSLSSDSLAIAHDLYLLITLGTFIKVYNMTLSIGILRAGGDNKYCMLIDFTGMWIVGIPLAFLGAFYFSFPLFYVALIAYSEEICKALMFTARMKSKRWLRNLTE